ncbi:200 kDa antigen p200, putative (fragment) [Pseudomonas sp. JV551A1]
MARRQPHQHDRQQRPQECAHGIQRLAQAEGCTTQFSRRNVGHQRVARRPTNAFANPVDEACHGQPLQPGGHGEYRLGQRPQAVAQHREQLAFAQPVAEGTGEHLGDRGGRLGDAFDKAHRHYRGAKHGDHVQRQQGVNHFRGDVHEHRYEAQRPDTARDLRQGRGGVRGVAFFGAAHQGARQRGYVRNCRSPHGGCKSGSCMEATVRVAGLHRSVGSSIVSAKFRYKHVNFVNKI